MQLEDVRVFIAIASGGSLTQAARALRSPKSSVTRRLARLESDLGRRLFDRTSRAVALTEHGRTLLPHARRLLDDADEASRALADGGREAAGRVIASATSLIGRRFVAPLLPEFRRRHPRVQVALWLHPDRSAVGTGPGEVDVAFRLRSVATPDVGCRKLADIGFALVAAPAYAARRALPAGPDALAEHDLVELGPASKDNRIELLRGSERRVVRFTPGIQIDEPEAVLAAVLAGGGIAALPEFLVRDDLARGRLTRALPGWAPAASALNLLYRTSSAPPGRVKVLVDFFTERLTVDNLYTAMCEP